MHQYFQTPLRVSLLINAAFSFICGLTLTVNPGLSGALLNPDFARFELLGMPILQGMGIGLVLFGLTVGLVGTRGFLPKLPIKLIIAADVLWVVTSGVLLFAVSGLFSDLGRTVVLVVALVVLTFSIAQAIGLLMLYQGASEFEQSRNGRDIYIRVARHVDAPGDKIWEVMTNHEAYAEFAKNLSGVEILEGDGLGMVRKCYGTDGTAWTEDAHIWEEGHRYGFQIRTNAHDYPYPLETLNAVWSIEQEGNSTPKVSMAFTVTPLKTLKGHLFGMIGSFTFPKVLDDILARWQDKMEARPGVR